VAAEVLDEALRTGPAGHYQSLSAMLDGRLVGWTCYGPTPCTIGTFDIYWIAVEPTCQKRGAGRVLIAAAEIGMQSRQARLAAVETSGTPRYAGTRCFYRKLGYRQTARIPDFYAPGDDKVIYTKRLAAPAPTLISVPTS